MEELAEKIGSEKLGLNQMLIYFVRNFGRVAVFLKMPEGRVMATGGIEPQDRLQKVIHD